MTDNSTRAEGGGTALPPQEQDRQPGSEAEMSPHPRFVPRFEGSDRLRGKTAFITGGDSGIGRATAVLFAREGANIVIHHKEEFEDAEATLESIQAEGTEALSLSGDIGDKAQVDRAVATAIERFGSINVLVNNAAEQHVQEDVTDISEAQLHRTFATNIFGQFYAVQAVLPQMREGDCIVNVTSVTAYHGQDMLIDYSSTKGAILAFTRALSKKYASRGIRVNAVAPGPIWTPLIPASFPSEMVEGFGQKVPLGRPGQPSEVAPCILFLACEDGSYMTGQTLHPNGGSLVGS